MSLKDILGDPHGKMVAVVVDDNTRVTPAEKLLLPLAEQLKNYGVKDEQIEVIFAPALWQQGCDSVGSWTQQGRYPGGRHSERLSQCIHHSCRQHRWTQSTAASVLFLH